MPFRERPHWMRANEAAEAVAAPEILRLKRQVEELQARLERARHIAPAGAERLAQGEQKYLINYSFDTFKGTETFSWQFSIELTWDTIFYDVGPIMLDEASEAQLKAEVTRMVQTRTRPDRAAN